MPTVIARTSPTVSVRWEFVRSIIERAGGTALGSVDRKTRRAFLGLLWDVRARSDLLGPERSEGEDAAEPLSWTVPGLLALSTFRRNWLRPLGEWVPDPIGVGQFPVFSSLAQHLLARYPVPPVLTWVWLGGLDWKARRQQRWYRHVGLGGSLRTAGFPVRLTRRMAHEFAHAPAHLPIGFALRWAQVRGLGGSDELACAVGSSRLGEELHDNDGFWVSVIQFLINHPDFDLSELAPVLDYLHAQKFDSRRVIIGNGGDETEICIDPPQPDVSLKGWTVASLMRRVGEWRERSKGGPEKRLIRWPRSGIGEYRREEGGQVWTIRELLDSDELAAEGKAMDHCVASYTDSCSKRETTIWSLGLEGQGDHQRTLTIEVNPETKEVVEAKMKDNDEPDERSRSLLEDWARQEGLKVGS
jgi:hypothetical protein